MAQFRNHPRRIAAVAMVVVGAAIGLSSLSIVRAERIAPAKTYDCSYGTACVEGSSTGSKTWGVYGVSNDSDGVHGRTNSTNGNSAVAGIAKGTTGNSNGVYGSSSNGDGVRGFSTGGASGTAFGVHGLGGPTGVYGSGSLYGVEGSSSGLGGVYGTGTFYGVVGSSSKGNGILAEGSASTGSGDKAALEAVGETAKTWLFYAVSNFGSLPNCRIDANANLTCTGTIKAPSLREQHRNGSGQQILSYASQSATATIEDVGTARISAGIANVRIDPAFASVMDGRWYYVFLTPLGDTRGLYVSMKTAREFQVRETEHGRSSLEFDYRIVAHPLDADSDRLPLAPTMSASSRPGHPTP